MLHEIYQNEDLRAQCTFQKFTYGAYTYLQIPKNVQFKTVKICKFLEFRLCRPFRNWRIQRYFTKNSRGIGISFQLAITPPLYTIIG